MNLISTSVYAGGSPVDCSVTASCSHFDLNPSHRLLGLLALKDETDYNYFHQRTAALRLIVRSWLDVLTFTTREHPAAESETLGEKCPVILPKCRFTLQLHLGIFYMP